jgi:6-phosphogluconolactonase (cycloisomerase 2 family)
VVAGDVLITDLGGDAIYRYRLDDGRLILDQLIEAPPGSGPRHFVRAGERWLVAAELSGQILTYGPDWSLLGHVPATTSAAECLVSEVAISEDGRFLYVANRGPDTIGVFSLDHDLPVYVTEVPTGQWPRHIAVAGGHLYAANELSDEVITMRIDPDSGVPEAIARLAVPSPTCVLIR